jgi:PncC family amidohydrolase
LKIVDEVKRQLEGRSQTVSTAESCTGGRLAAAFTSLPGSSIIFPGGVVTYSNSMKEKILDVDKRILETHGAVSKETVELMAKGACKLFASDWSLVTSGVAGPGGGSKEKPVGLVWMAIGSKSSDPIVWAKNFTGSREKVMEQAVEEVLLQFLPLLS